MIIGAIVLAGALAAALLTKSGRADAKPVPIPVRVDDRRKDRR